MCLYICPTEYTTLRGILKGRMSMGPKTEVVQVQQTTKAVLWHGILTLEEVIREEVYENFVYFVLCFVVISKLFQTIKSMKKAKSLT